MKILNFDQSVFLTIKGISFVWKNAAWYIKKNKCPAEKLILQLLGYCTFLDRSSKTTFSMRSWIKPSKHYHQRNRHSYVCNF